MTPERLAEIEARCLAPTAFIEYIRFLEAALRDLQQDSLAYREGQREMRRRAADAVAASPLLNTTDPSMSSAVIRVSLQGAYNAVLRLPLAGEE
jgi:hypothetical protein